MEIPAAAPPTTYTTPGREETRGRSSQPTDEGLTAGLLELTLALVSRRHRLYAILGVTVVLVALHWLIAGRKYTAEVAFTPEQNLQEISSSANIASLASRFGVSVNTGLTPLPFYTELLQSRELLTRLVTRPLPALEGGEDDTTVITLLDLHGDPSTPHAHQLDQAITASLSATLTSVNLAANIVTVEYTASDPVIAAATANAYVELVNEFNVGERQSQAKSLRAFLEDVAIPQAAKELDAAEDSVALFYGANKSFEASPLLRLEEARLQRRIAIKQQSYLALASQLEQARVDEVRNTPAITVVSHAAPPVRPSSPRLLINLVVAFVLAVSVWAFSVLIQLYGRALRREHASQARELLEETTSAVAELRKAIPGARGGKQASA